MVSFSWSLKCCHVFWLLEKSGIGVGLTSSSVFLIKAGVAETGKCASILMCYAPTSRTAEEHVVDIILVDSEALRTSVLYRSCSFANVLTHPIV